MTVKPAFLQFKQAHPTDAEILTATAIKSKKMWNYPEEQMNLWADELTITTAYIVKNKVYKILRVEKYIGFISLIKKNNFLEIDHFWLLPENTGKGHGRAVFNFIVQTAKTLNYNRIRVYSEPNADGFYKKMDGKIIQKQESKIKGRYLAVFEFNLEVF